MNRQKRAIINGIAIGVIIIAAIFIALEIQGQNKPQPTTASSSVPIGGNFALTDDEGIRRTNDDFAGTNMLVYFGYTFCPDVCPLDLQKMTLALSQLEENGFDISQLSPLFITIDPERDTPEVMHEYLQSFHPNILGLSGSLYDVKTAAGAFRVYFNKGEVDADGSYLMDHSSIIYLMDKNGRYLSHYSPSLTLDDMVKDISNKVSNGR